MGDSQVGKQEQLFSTEEMVVVDAVTLAYLAGFFDGEGYIGIAKNQVNSSPPGFTLICTVTQTSMPILEKYRHYFGGRVEPRRFNHPNPRWAPSWGWRISGGLAVRFLHVIGPHLILKAPQVPIALRFYEQYHPLVYRGSGFRPRVATQLAEQCRADLMALHQGRLRDHTRKKTRVLQVPPTSLLDMPSENIELTHEP